MTKTLEINPRKNCSAPLPELDFYGIINLIRKLLSCDILSQKEAENIALRIAGDMDVKVSFSL